MLSKLVLTVSACGACLIGGLVNAAPVTVNFHYSGRDVTSEASGIFGGNGSFTYELVADRTTYSLSDLSDFSFNWGATVPNLGTANWNYGIGNLSAFSFNLLNVNAFAITTSTVSASNNLFTDATFFASGINGQTARGDSGLVLTQGAITVDKLSAIDKQKYADAAREADIVSTTFGLLGCAEGARACFDAIVPGLTSGGDSPVLKWLGYLGLIAATAAAISSGSLFAMTLVAVAITGAFAGYMSEIQQKIADDPPDANYTVVSVYSNDATSVGIGANGQFDGLLTATASKMTRCLEAHQFALKAMERYQGAVLAGDTFYANLQYDAMNSFFADSESCGENVGINLVQIADFLAQLGASDIPYSPQDLLSARDMLINSGDPELASRFSDLDINTLPTGISVQSTLRGYGQLLAQTNNVPEPSSTALLALGFVVLALSRKRKPGRVQKFCVNEHFAENCRLVRSHNEQEAQALNNCRSFIACRLTALADISSAGKELTDSSTQLHDVQVLTHKPAASGRELAG